LTRTSDVKEKHGFNTEKRGSIPAYSENRWQLEKYGYDHLLDNFETAAGISGYRRTLLRKLIRDYAPAMTL